jgi:hypothetical protein
VTQPIVTSSHAAGGSPAGLTAIGGFRPVMLTVANWCAVAGFTRSATYDAIKDGSLKSVVIRGRRLIPYSEAERLLREALQESEPAMSSRAANAEAATTARKAKRLKLKVAAP